VDLAARRGEIGCLLASRR